MRKFTKNKTNNNFFQINIMVVIYRKYRPKTFSEIVGQEHIIKILQNQLLSNQVSHAYLFYGPRGTGKTTVGRLLAKAINCQNSQKIKIGAEKRPQIEPCNQCSSCQQINQQRSIDLIEIDAASNRGIEEIRNLREGAKIVPTMSKYKIYILDEAHQLTSEASNALLKTLEEPPKHVIFILCTTEFSKVLPTIASRCQKFNFKKLNVGQIEQKLKKDAEGEKIKIENEVLNLIARASGGSIRDAEGLLDKVITLQDKIITKEEVEEILGFVETKIISELIDAILSKNQKKCFAILETNLEQDIDIGQFTKSILEYLRNLLLIKIDHTLLSPETSGFTKEEIEILKKQSEKIEKEKLEKIIEKLLETQNLIRWSDNPRIPLEIAIAKSVAIV